MAESKGEASSSVDPKQKKSLLDEEIGTEFLSSWKSMSVTEDDTMDFSFDTVSSGNKRKFNFDKLDMDFNLDGDFAKLSSFKVDMPDLDFLSLAKETAKPRNGSEEESSEGNHQGKQDRFTFSFDFNELDGFKFDSCLMKGEKFSNEKLDTSGTASEKPELQGSKVQLLESIGTLDHSITTKLPSLQLEAISKAEKVVGVSEVCKTETITNSNVSHGVRISSEKMVTYAEETGRPNQILEDAMPIETQIEERILQDRPVQSVGGNGSSQETALGVQTDVYSVGTRKNMGSDKEQNVNDKTTSGPESNHENSLSNNTSLRHVTESESSKSESKRSASNGSTEGVDKTESAQGDSDIKHTSSQTLPRTKPLDISASSATKNSTFKLPSITSASEPASDKLRPANEKEVAVVRSKFFRRSEECGPQSGQPLSAAAEVSSSGSQEIAAMPSHFSNEKRPGGHANGLQKGSHLIDDSRPQDEGISEEKSVTQITENNTGCVQVNPMSFSKKPAKFRTLTCANPKLLQSIWNSKATSVELKTGNKTSDLSRLKNLRTIDEIKDPSGSTLSSLKRKKIEESNAELVSSNPLKRLLESSSESRNSEEISEKIVQKEVCNNDNLVGSSTKKVVYDHAYSELEIPRDETPLIMENEGNVGKAEAYTKELEEICNLLRKKHDEAKEILVRAVVNNNNLLMLNHPIYEEKIRTIQQFSARLMSKNFQV